MIIQLRIAGADLGSIKNTIFKPTRSFKMAIYPLPPDEWVGKQTCSICGGKPDFIQGDSKPICKACIKRIMNGLNKKESTTETSVPITMDIVTSTRFEWSVDGDKWYSLYGRNIKPNRPELFLKELRTSILESRPMAVEADYEKETRTMTITL